MTLSKSKPGFVDDLSSIRAFKVLLGGPEDTPSSFGSSQTLLPPGHEHNLLITPTFIRCTGHWTLDTGHWTLDTGHWTLDTGQL